MFKIDAATAAAKSLQSCPSLCNPTDGSPPGSPVPGFSRQEHWSGLPLPSPMHESESESEVAQSCLTLSGSLLGELRSHKLCSMAKNISTEIFRNNK